MNITIFKDLFKATDVPYIVPVDKIIQRLKEGAAKELVLKIRDEHDKDKKNKLKYRLPVILFSGEFSERNKSGLIKHSGLMVTDFDKMPDDKEYNRIYEILKNNKHVYLMFRSPSGNGIKAIIKIPECNKYDHEKYFKAFNKKYKIDYWDKANCDVSRVCFESYDKNPYINKNAETFNANLIDEGYLNNEYVSHTPLVDEDKIIERIMAWSWEEDFSEGNRNNYIYHLGGVFCEFGISENSAEEYIKKNIANGDFSSDEIKNTIKNVYKKRMFSSRFFEDYDRKKQLETDIIKEKKDKVLKKFNINENEYDEIKEKIEHNIFWFLTKEKNIKIDPLRFKYFLERNGFKKYFHENSQKPTLVKIKSNKVKETSTEKIKDFILTYLLEKKEYKVWSYCSQFNNLFSDNFLLMLETVELMMLSDTKNESFIAYENGILKVTKDKIELIDYIDINGYIWESQIIKREFKKEKTIKNQYYEFIKNISNKDTRPTESTIGYLLSTYKNKMNTKAVIINDEIITDNPEGGTGKGLFVQGLMQIRNVSVLDGKSFDDKKSFPYQTVSTETQILVFDDVKKNWDFESKFSLVTEGITLERKNKDAIKLSVKESPKMIVSTNYAIKGEGNSHDRRRHEIEIAQYYGKEITPYEEFNCELFDDWNSSEWSRFDNYMVNCLQIYLNDGLIKQNAKNIKLRKFLAETSMDFYEWVQDDVNFPLNVRNNKREYFNKFIDEYKDYNKWLKNKRFSIWINKYASFKNLIYKDGVSNGNRWFEIVDSDKIINEVKPPF